MHGSFQVLLGGQYGEITIVMQYPFLGWKTHVLGQYRDMGMVFGSGAEEFGHVGMLATVFFQLLEKQLLGVAEGTMHDDRRWLPSSAAQTPDRPSSRGAGAGAVDSNGDPWSGAYTPVQRAKMLVPTNEVPAVKGICPAGTFVLESGFLSGRAGFQHDEFCDGLPPADQGWVAGFYEDFGRQGAGVVVRGHACSVRHIAAVALGGACAGRGPFRWW